MRQKYVVSRDGPKSDLKITEYAVIGKNSKNVVTTTSSQHLIYTLTCEETYENEKIANGIAKGRKALVLLLRTQNMYPTMQNAILIADSVITFYASLHQNPVEVYFDDMQTEEADGLNGDALTN